MRPMPPADQVRITLTFIGKDGLRVRRVAEHSLGPYDLAHEVSAASMAVEDTINNYIREHPETVRNPLI